MNNTRREKKLSHKVLISGLAVIFSLVMVLTMISAPTVQISSNISPQVAESTGSYIPNPTMNTNITWSTFYNGWNPLEYSNGTANLTLNTAYSSLYANPINVNPLDIKGSIQNYTKRIASSTTNLEWNEISPPGEWAGGSRGGVSGGAVFTLSNTSGLVQFTLNTSAASSNGQGAGICIDTASLPSTNLQYDYLTASAEITSGTLITGLNLSIGLNSAHCNRTEAHVTYTTSTHTPVYMSVPLSQYAADIGYNTSGTYYPRLDVLLNVPQSTTATTYTVEIGDFAITTYANSIGTSVSNGSIQTITNIVGNAHLTTLAPSFNWTEVDNSGYTVATSQTLQNLITQQNSINTNNYIEQATFQGTFELPTAPDLSYSNTNITLPMALPGSQYEVSNLNGVSYLSQIQAKSNGTFAFGTVNPNSQNTIILEVEFTAAQWNASSTAPSFWSIQGLEYYWWIGIIGLLSLIGLGSVANAHWGGTEENLKVPKGKFGR